MCWRRAGSSFERKQTYQAVGTSGQIGLLVGCRLVPDRERPGGATPSLFRTCWRFSDLSHDPPADLKGAVSTKVVRNSDIDANHHPPVCDPGPKDVILA